MSKNRFEQVDEFQPDAINLKLIKRDGGDIGIVHCPKTAAPEHFPADLTSEDMPLRDAVIGAIQLANSRKLPVVVLDPDGIWDPQYGALWRYSDDD